MYTTNTILAQLNVILENLSEKNDFFDTIAELKNRTFILNQKIKTEIEINNDMEYYKCK